ncbi:muropeptide MFS transporter AmpG, partial [Salmonella enterica subsp. enterica serovar Poona]|nr:muropeptide MFS transporter AmpG [Salmonella enterica subsp. enterica serovar Poona]
YNFALSILLAGVALLAVWVLLLTMNAVDYTNFSFLPGLLETAVVVAVCGIVFGGLLDYLALRKTRLL